MEEQWLVDRTHLRQLKQTHPEWSPGRLAETVGCSVSWVEKWVKRLAQADPGDEQVLLGQSRARKQPPPRIAAEVEQAILTIRDEPPEELQRVPGPKAIHYYLHQNRELKSKYYLPNSTATFWKILSKHQRIWHAPPVTHQPVPRPEPGQEWHLDFKDVGSVPPEVEGKQQHYVQTLNILDPGNSVLVDNPARDDYTAETAIRTLAEVLQAQGKPKSVTFDRDTRFVASWSGRDFPSAFVRFLLCLGIQPKICPPHRPDKNGFVERLNKTYEYECLRIYHPETLTTTHTVNAHFKHRYNFQRPNQAITCHNQPPRVAFPDLPTLEPLPAYVDPDAWLFTIDGRCFKRRVNYNGSIQFDKHDYYIQQELQGHYVILQVDAKARQFVVKSDQIVLKRLSIKGLHHGILPLADYIERICQEAISEWRRSLAQAKRSPLHTMSAISPP